MKNKQVKVTLSHSQVSMIVSVILMCLLIGTGSLDANGWSREINGGIRSAIEFSYQPFILVIVGGQDDHVHGLFAFCNYQTTPFVIEGTKDPEGEFYPYVSMQVAEADRKWKTIGGSLNEGTAAILSVEPKGVSKTLMVDMDIFRSTVGKAKYGRVVLKSGEAAEFELKDLLPPQENEKETNAPMKR